MLQNQRDETEYFGRCCERERGRLNEKKISELQKSPNSSETPRRGTYPDIEEFESEKKAHPTKQSEEVDEDEAPNEGNWKNITKTEKHPMRRV